MQPTNNNPQNQLVGYYDIDGIAVTTPMTKVTCQNRGFSYGQWLIALKQFREEYDYHILVEDDTVGAISNFDSELIRIYELTFPDGVGYLCGLAGKSGLVPHHAAISYGIISKKTVAILFEYWKDNPYDELGTLGLRTYNKSKKVTNTIESGGGCQIEFSILMTMAGIPIKDYSKYYSVPYWLLSPPKQDIFVEYSQHYNRPLIIPTQMLHSKFIKYDQKQKKHFD
jgi:hypothetical protein